MEMMQVFDESTGKVVGSVPKYTGEEISAMVDTAYEAQSRWERTSVYERGKILYKFCDLLEQHADEIGNYMACEIGKPINEGWGETVVTAEIGRNNIEVGKHMYGQVLTDVAPWNQNDTVYVKHEALGVVAIVVPFNFPVLLSTIKIVPALLMGNTVIVKAPTVCPCCVKKVVDLAHEAGVPEDVLQFITASRDDCKEHLLTNKKVACLALTGSNAAGTDMINCSAPTIKKVVLELGGNDPLVVCGDIADDPEEIKKAVDSLIAGRVLANNGQVCASPKRILVQNKVHDAFVKGVLDTVKTLKRGHATDPTSQVTRLVSSTAAKRVEEQVKLTVDQGADLLYGGKSNGPEMDVTVLDNVTRDMDIARDMEVFGPVITIIPFETDEEAVEIANQSIYGLNSGVITKDMNKAFYFANEIKASGVWVNPVGNHRHNDQPFGGCKGSGLGVEGGGYSCAEFSRMKTVGFVNVSPKESL